ncbi:MAG: HEAT repeat domain-containing protein [Pirellulales bacterium]|nr:HEAT repeat domain-containing protein [Pirellulales bacterium]
MIRIFYFLIQSWMVSTIVGGLPSGMTATGAEIPASEAWEALPKYEPGQDMAALLAIDREVIAAMKTPENRAACAAKLARILTQRETTHAARQYICLQLRQVGTASEVPLLEKLLEQSQTAEIARYALESIPGPEATLVLRNALSKSEGKQLVGVIGSVAKRKDTAAIQDLTRLLDSTDPQVATAAIRALGNIAESNATHVLLNRAEKAGIPTPQVLACALLHGATGDPHAQEIYTKLSQSGQPEGIRRAALEGLLRLEGERGETTVLGWLFSDDTDRRRIATGHLQQFSDEQLDKLLAGLADLPDANKQTVVELAVARRGAKMLPMVMSFVESSNNDLKVVGIRSLGMIGDISSIPILIDRLPAGGDVTLAAQSALRNLPRKEVVSALLDALKNRDESRVPVIDLLMDLQCNDAIDPLIEIAADANPTLYGPALDGLRGIAAPNNTDIPRLINLLLRSQAGKHRDEVEKTILIVCDKLPANANRSELVLAALVKVDPSEMPKYLPMLGRLGGSQPLRIVEASLASPDEAVRESAERALCNWPNADVATKLLHLVSEAENPTSRRRSLRAYIRVVSLKSDRPDTETLAMLQQAFNLSDGADEKRLVIARTSTVRTMEAVNWIAQFLDDPELAQASCHALVELAHHRFLRHPNMKQFGPILEKVSKISDDPSIVERAKRYRLGL